MKVGDLSLGRYEREIAQMLLAGDPGQPGDFHFSGTLILDDEKRPDGTVGLLAHGTGRLEGHHYYLMTYAYCDWVFIIARPGPAWTADIEARCRNGNVFPLLVTHYAQSKGFNLSVDILRELRTDWRS